MIRVPMKWLALIVCGASLATQVGCATYYASRIPGPTNDESIAIGMHRSEVESLLGTSAVSVYDERDGVTARYEYSDGPPQATKGRVIVYIAADLFTAFLSELVFWPIEVYATNRTKRVGSASYDSNNRLAMFTVTRADGEHVMTVGTRLETPVAASIAAGEPMDSEPIEVAKPELSRESDVESSLPEVSAGATETEAADSAD